VLVHSGGAFGGHYYAFIKSFEDGKWYRFDDSSVNEISQDDIAKTFGDKFGGPTAYLLMYKQYNPAEKMEPITVPATCIPEYLKSEIDEETEQLIRINYDKEEKLLSIRIKVWFNNDLKVFSLKRTDTLKELALRCYEIFPMDGIEMSDMRFRNYDNVAKVKMDVFDNMEKTIMDYRFIAY
jgi:ubiquitin carboxyl-terminal hydrolase 47